MEDNPNNNENINRFNDRYEKGITDLLEEKELKTKWHKEILENDSMQEYFKSFNEISVKTFITFYLTEKYLAYKHADSLARQVETKRSRWIDAAHDHLKVIQHKKLFDLQCRWRAEQVTLEDIEICLDFMTMHDTVLDCPFLEPITDADIAMYQEYLLTSDIDYRYITDLYEMQKYEDYKANHLGEEEDGHPLPDWYDFHNLRTGNAILMLLPDIRGEKEHFYSRLHWDDVYKDHKPSAPYVPDRRPYLDNSDHVEVSYFVSTFEDEETRKKYGNYMEISKNDSIDEDFRMDELLDDMRQEEEYIPVEAHYDFRQALYNAYNTFNLKNIAAHLPLAHQQYLFNRKMGFTTEQKKSVFVNIRNVNREAILHGREMNGEERNFDF